MKTYTTLKNLFVSLSQNSSSDNRTLAGQLINDGHRYLFQKYYDNERSYTVPGGTIQGVQEYTLPFNNFQVKDVTVRVGGFLYTPPEILTRQQWDYLNFVQYQSTFPFRYFIYNNKLLIFPIPSANGDPITINYKIRMPDLVLDDVTTGTVSVNINTVVSTTNLFGGTSSYTTATGVVTTGGTGTSCTVDITAVSGVITAITINNPGSGYSVGDTLTITGGDGTATFEVAAVAGGRIVTGSGTSWAVTTGINELRWLNIPFPGGDNEWYQVESVDSTTQLTLVSPYSGITAVSGSSYTLGQVPIIREDFQDLLVYRPLMIYFSSINKDDSKKAQFEGLYNDGISRMDEYEGMKSTDVSLGTEAPTYNSNLFWQQNP